MTRTFSLLSCFLTFQLFVFSQNKYPGFYTTKSGETVNGFFPQFKEWKFNPSSVGFETNAGQSIQLTPETCNSFTVTGFDTYESMEIRRMTNLTRFYDIKNPEKSDGDKFDTIRVFLRKIYSVNAINLYEFIDNRRENYFIKTTDGLTELIFKVDYKEGGGRGESSMYIVEDKRYIDQLRALFAFEIEKNKRLGRKLNSLRYTEAGLVSFFNEVYNSGDNISKQTPGISREILFTAGASYNTFKVTPYNSIYEFTTPDYKPSVAPVLGIGIIEYGKRRLRNYFLTAELKYSSFKNAGKDPSGKEWVFQSQILGAQVGLGRKLINNKRFTWYSSFHGSLSVFINNKPTGFTINSGQTIEEVRYFIANIGIQTGFFFNDFGVWAQYNPRVVTHIMARFRPELTSINAGISWRLPLKK
jgi:hypothetical protein